MLVKAGSTLLVPRGNALLADVSSHVADNAVLALAPDGPPLRKMSLRAGRRDSVASVARRYRVSAGAGGAVERHRRRRRASAPGQSVVVYVAHGHAPRRPRRLAGRAPCGNTGRARGRCAAFAPQRSRHKAGASPG